MTLGLEQQGAHLLWLEALEGLSRAGEPVGVGCAFLEGPRLRSRLLVEIDVTTGQQTLARRPNRQRLVLDHGPQPAHRTLGLKPMRAP